MTDFTDIDRDLREQQATKSYEEWLGSEEYKNSVQLKYEALLCDGDILSEAIGADGIVYPFGLRGSWRDVRARQREYENDTYYPYIAAAVIRDDAEALGKLLLSQIKTHVMDAAKEKVQEGYNG